MTIRNLAPADTERILDVGSPKIAPLYIWARYGATVYATDLHRYFHDEYRKYVRALAPVRPPETFVIETVDASNLPFPDRTFDTAFAISVLEHIAGDGDNPGDPGDRQVLRPGGICVVTVPISQEYEEVLTTRESYYIKPADNQPTFYERRYDRTTLMRRLVEPSGLRLARAQYFAERGLGYERWYEVFPRWLKIATAPLSRWASRALLAEYPRYPEGQGTATVVLTLVR